MATVLDDDGDDDSDYEIQYIYFCVMQTHLFLFQIMTDQNQ